MLKIRIALLAVFCGFCFLIGSCSYPSTPVTKLRGPGDPTDLVFFYKKDVTNNQKEVFQNTVIHQSNEDRTGYRFQPGVVDLFSVIKSGYQGYGINFSKSATAEEREKLESAIRSSPLVLRVYVNTVPNDINDLPGSDKPESNSQTPDARPKKQINASN